MLSLILKAQDYPPNICKLLGEVVFKSSYDNKTNTPLDTVAVALPQTTGIDHIRLRILYGYILVNTKGHEAAALYFQETAALAARQQMPSQIQAYINIICGDLLTSLNDNVLASLYCSQAENLAEPSDFNYWIARITNNWLNPNPNTTIIIERALDSLISKTAFPVDEMAKLLHFHQDNVPL
ncbi:MAG: hypothetical protein HC821_02070, partial [Lewinella sp.]|nr:hypothetical protein [Lewinella sp.]